MSELIDPTPALAGPLREALNLLKDGQTTTISVTRVGDGAYVCIATTPAAGENGEHYPSVAGEVQQGTIDQEIAASYREQLPARISIAAATVSAVQKTVAGTTKAQAQARPSAPATPATPTVPAGSIVTTAAPSAAGTLKPLPMGGMTLTSTAPGAQMPPPAAKLVPALFDD